MAELTERQRRRIRQQNEKFGIDVGGAAEAPRSPSLQAAQGRVDEKRVNIITGSDEKSKEEQVPADPVAEAIRIAGPGAAPTPATAEAAVGIVQRMKTKEVKDFVDHGSSLLGGANKQARRDAVKDLTEPDRLAGLLSRLDEAATSEKKELSNSDKFSTALMSLLPAVVGSLFEAEQPGSFQKGLGTTLSTLQREKELEQRKAQLDQDREVSNLKFQVGQEFGLLKQRLGREPTPFEIRQEQRRERQLGVQERSLESREELGRRRVSVAEEKQELDRLQKESLSEPQLKAINANQNIVASIDELDLGDLSSTGPVEGRIRDLASELGVSEDEAFNRIQSQVGLQFAKFLKEMSGTAASDAEVARLQKLLPGVSQNRKQFLDKLRVFRREAERSLETLNKTISRAQPLRAGAAARATKVEKSPVGVRRGVSRRTAQQEQRLRELLKKAGK